MKELHDYTTNLLLTNIYTDTVEYSDLTKNRVNFNGKFILNEA